MIAFLLQPSVDWRLCTASFLTAYVREVYLPRLTTPTYAHRFPHWRPTTRVKVFYCDTASQLERVHQVILHIPGGGFVCMRPEDHEDYLRQWANDLGPTICIVSVDYGKVGHDCCDHCETCL